jgi:hypothetical protein
VPDIGANVGLITAARHHLVFGRRGAGKTALLLEGKRLIEASGGVTVWLNMHTFRSEDWQTTFLWIANEVLSRLEGFVRGEPKLTNLATRILETKDRIISVVNSNQKTTRASSRPFMMLCLDSVRAQVLACSYSLTTSII